MTENDNQKTEGNLLTINNTQQGQLPSYWMPFSANRKFNADPIMFVGAKGMYFTRDNGAKVLDGIAGLWCTACGHGRPEITDAVQKQLTEMDYSTPFQISHPQAFEFATRLCEKAPEGLERVFYSNSGSEAMDTALKIVLGYHAARGEGQRTRLIGREKSYHGVGFGGISIGGIDNNRKGFGPLLSGVDHLPHTLNQDHNTFCRGLPPWGEHLADDLERIINLHGAETIAAVIVEPVSGAGGVIIPAPGYLQKLRETCTQNGILLIFDEVITGFGRLGHPFAGDFFGVTPDILTTAKALTNATIPMGATLLTSKIQDAFLQGPENLPEFFHGYTYSGHPVSIAAANATQDIFDTENLWTRVQQIGPVYEEKIHALREDPYVKDIRNIGLMGAVDLESSEKGIGVRANKVFKACLERGILVRPIGDSIITAPPLVITEEQIDETFGVLSEVLNSQEIQ